MGDLEQRFHETWIGMVQPVEGLVVSIPVLVEAQCMERQGPEVQGRLLELAPKTVAPPRDGHGKPTEGPRAIADLEAFLRQLLGYAEGSFHAGDAIPEALALYVPEGKQTVRPTLALPKLDAPAPAEGADLTAAARAGAGYELLVWDVPRGLDLDKPETATGPWAYPASAKFDRLLRHTRVPVGVLTNREVVRLVYAPHGESSGAITFRLDDMATVGGRPILDALVMLLSAHRVQGVAADRALPALLAESRKRQANVTNALAEQVFDALALLLRGFEAAAERDGHDLLDEALARPGDHLYQGLLTVLLRLVFVLYAEDRGLLPIEHPLYAEHLSIGALYERLQVDRGAYPDSMPRRFGAWSRLLSLFRTIFLGAKHGDMRLPPRHGSLFDPHRFSFLEGWPQAGGAPVDAEGRAELRVPTVDDDTIHRVLEKLLLLEGQRLSYRALDVEQIGSVYEALMGYHVVRLTADAVCMRPARVWVTAEEALEVPAGRRAKWLKETTGLAAAQAEKLAQAIAAAAAAETRTAGAATVGADVREALAAFAIGGKRGGGEGARAKLGQLVLQPGQERRRTSSHYTPRSLSAPIVQRTIEPLLACMGEARPSHLILELKICDPAMGSGAFLVEACRFLADAVVSAWTREGALEEVTQKHGEPLMHARRLVAQRCLYGVDKNAAAVELAKLSLWLVTLARELPFTFVDHALRHGDSLVGLDFEQIRSFHWKPQKQLDFCSAALDEALGEAIELRQRILDLAEFEDEGSQREKEHLLWDANDAMDRVRLVGDLIVGAFFGQGKDKARETERRARQDVVAAWLLTGEPPTEELLGMRAEVLGVVVPFHWMLEFPEVFHDARPDPLDGGKMNGGAFFDAFIGNPPFAGKNAITDGNAPGYLDYLMATHPDVVGRPNTDLCAYFFRRAASKLGAHGTIGLVATNTIAQGDSRLMSLKALTTAGARIYDARSSFPWPGAASVAVSVVHLALGSARAAAGTAILNERVVTDIDSRLDARRERDEAQRLASNAGIAFMGGKLVGAGLAVSAEERDRLVAADPSNALVLRPYLGGEEVNQNPGGAFDRYVIDFTAHTLEEARRWPDLMKIVEERVRPARERDNRGTYKTYWWRPGESGSALYQALGGSDRCLVAANVTKHLMFSFAPTSWFFSQTLYVFAIHQWSSFVVLQSRLHDSWARLLSSSMRTDLRYSASDCFETFPFPQSDPRSSMRRLEKLGEQVYDSRAKYMLAESVGLTSTYNRLKDPACQDVRVVTLRRLHEEMDRAVLDAYGWTDVELPPYCALTEDGGSSHFEAAVIERLFALNAERAEEERRKGLATGAKQKGKGKASAESLVADDQMGLKIEER